MSRISTRTLALAVLAVSLLLAGVGSYYASSHPDGLAHVAETVGFADSASEPSTSDSPFADYATQGVEDARLSGGLAGVVGVLAVGVIMGGTVLLLRRRARDPDENSTHEDT